MIPRKTNTPGLAYVGPGVIFLLGSIIRDFRRRGVKEIINAVKNRFDIVRDNMASNITKRRRTSSSAHSEKKTVIQSRPRHQISLATEKNNEAIKAAVDDSDSAKIAGITIAIQKSLAFVNVKFMSHNKNKKKKKK